MGDTSRSVRLTDTHTLEGKMDKACECKHETHFGNGSPFVPAERTASYAYVNRHGGQAAKITTTYGDFTICDRCQWLGHTSPTYHP